MALDKNMVMWKLVSDDRLQITERLVTCGEEGFDFDVIFFCFVFLFVCFGIDVGPEGKWYTGKILKPKGRTFAVLEFRSTMKWNCVLNC